MVGNYYLILQAKRVRYELTFDRNITVIKGKSGTGKSTLISRLQEFADGPDSGLLVDTNIPNIVVLDARSNYTRYVDDFYRSVIFVDEDFPELTSREFVAAVKNSGAYLVCISRSTKLGGFSYAIDSIYQFSSSSKDGMVTTRMSSCYVETSNKIRPELIITEDKTSGHDIVEHVVNRPVLSAEGNSKINEVVRSNLGKSMYVLVDGAAFGFFIAQFMRVIEKYDNVRLVAPECFEYLILNTFGFKKFLTDELTATYKYADSAKYNTWENYYEDLLRELIIKYPGGHYNKETWGNLFKIFKSERFLKEIADQLYDLSPEVIDIRADKS